MTYHDMLGAHNDIEVCRSERAIFGALFKQLAAASVL
jgi:hypothetical protein